MDTTLCVFVEIFGVCEHSCGQKVPLANTVFPRITPGLVSFPGDYMWSKVLFVGTNLRKYSSFDEARGAAAFKKECKANKCTLCTLRNPTERYLRGVQKLM